jgi:hypothetical protein
MKTLLAIIALSFALLVGNDKMPSVVDDDSR